MSVVCGWLGIITAVDVAFVSFQLSLVVGVRGTEKVFVLMADGWVAQY